MKKIFCILLLLTLTACPAVHKVNPEFQDMGNAVSKHTATGFYYPFSIDHFYTVTKADYDSSGTHYSVGYNDRKNFVAVTTYVYPKNLIPEASDIKSQFMLEKQTIQGFYQTAQLLEERAVAYPNFNGLKATFLLPQKELFNEAAAELQNGQNLSELYLFRGNQYNVKFRISYYANNAAASQQAIEAFITKWMAMNANVAY